MHDVLDGIHASHDLIWIVDHWETLLHCIGILAIVVLSIHIFSYTNRKGMLEEHLKSSLSKCVKRQSKNGGCNSNAKFEEHVFGKELLMNMYIMNMYIIHISKVLF